MIIDFIIRLLCYLLGFFNWITPDWRIPQDYLDVLPMFWNLGTPFDYLFPVSILFKCVLFIVGFEVTLRIAQIIARLITIIRGGGTSPLED